MRRTKKILSLMLASLMAISMMSVTAFAKEPVENTGDLSTEEESFLTKNIKTTDTALVGTDSAMWASQYLTVNADEASDGATPLFTSSGGHPVYLKKGKTADNLKTQISRSIESAMITQKSQEIMGAGDLIEADTTAASALLSGFTPVLNMALGVIVVLVTMGMTVFSAFDICYIAFPVFRNKCEEAKASGTGMMASNKSSNGETSLRFVTADAQYAVKEGSIESGKSPWAIYFKKRIMSYILLAIILFILMTGNITLITNIALKLVSGIMNVLAGLAA